VLSKKSNKCLTTASDALIKSKTLKTAANSNKSAGNTIDYWKNTAVQQHYAVRRPHGKDVRDHNDARQSTGPTQGKENRTAKARPNAQQRKPTRQRQKQAHDKELNHDNDAQNCRALTLPWAMLGCTATTSLPCVPPFAVHHMAFSFLFLSILFLLLLIFIFSVSFTFC
jgi:hypothetical protein